MQRPFNLTERREGGILFSLENKSVAKEKKIDKKDTSQSSSFVVFKGNF